MSPRPCPVCGELGTEPVLERADAPVFCNVLWETAEEARAAPTGPISLRWCPSCRMLWNAAFDPALVEYAPGYENSLHSSTVFGRYAQELADRLVARYDLAGKTVVDVGCGRGEFLALVCAGGRARGLGFDPSLPEETNGLPETVGLVPDVYTADDARAARPDLVTCRHVLEHLVEPLAFLEEIRRGLETRPGAVLYVEVPSGDWILRDAAVWDVIYEHPSYFTAYALLEALGRAGFRVLDHGTSFGGQYLWAEAAPHGSARPVAETNGDGRRDRGAGSLGRAFADAVAAWSERLGSLLADGDVAVWGAGSKGVTFLTSVPGAGGVRFVVDVNERKHARHVPLTGQAVSPPARLAGEPVRAVVAMNGLYEREIAAELERLGVGAEVLVA